MSLSPVLSMNSVRVDYGANAVVRDFTADIARGKVTALIGPNGCGKSTLMKSLVRIVPVRSGQVQFDGRSIRDISPKVLARHISFLPQVLPVPEGITVRQLVSFGRSPHNNVWGMLQATDREVVDYALSRMSMADLAGIDVAELSGGQRQRAWVAMTLAQETPVLLLDEPTTYLDISHQVELLELARALAREGRTVVVVLHDLNQAFRYADHVVVMDAGRVVASREPSRIATPELLRSVFGIDAVVGQDPEADRPMVIVKRRPQADLPPSSSRDDVDRSPA